MPDVARRRHVAQARNLDRASGLQAPRGWWSLLSGRLICSPCSDRLHADLCLLASHTRACYRLLVLFACLLVTRSRAPSRRLFLACLPRDRWLHVRRHSPAAKPAVQNWEVVDRWAGGAGELIYVLKMGASVEWTDPRRTAASQQARGGAPAAQWAGMQREFTVWMLREKINHSKLSMRLWAGDLEPSWRRVEVDDLHMCNTISKWHQIWRS